MRRLLFILLGLLFAGTLRGQIYFYESFDEMPSDTTPTNWIVTYSPLSYLGNSYWKVHDSYKYKKDAFGYFGVSTYELVEFNPGHGKFVSMRESFGFGSGPFRDSLISPVINLPASASSVSLSFLMHIEQTSSSVLEVYAFNGIQWQLLGQYGNAGTQKIDIDISQHVNSLLRIAFVFAYGASNSGSRFVGVDEVVIYEKNWAEIVPVKVRLNPNKVCPFSASESVFFHIQNTGVQNASNIRLKYTVYRNGQIHGTPVIDTLPSLWAGRDTTYRFQKSVDMSQEGEYYVKAEILDGQGYYASSPSVLSQRYSLYEIYEGKNYLENFDSTAWYIQEIWEFKPEVHLQFVSGTWGNYYTADNFGWLPRFGRYEEIIGASDGPAWDYTVGAVGQDSIVGGYLATSKLYSNSLGKTVAYSPCFRFNPPQYLPYTFSTYYHANGTDIARMEVELWDSASQQWVLVHNIFGNQHSYQSDPWTFTYKEIPQSLYGKISRLRLTAYPLGSQSSVIAFDKISVGVPREGDIKVEVIGGWGCPTGKDSVGIILRNVGNSSIFITPNLPLQYTLKVFANGIMQTYSGQATSQFPGVPQYEVPPGEYMIIVTPDTFDFSVPGNYTFQFTGSHYQDENLANNSIGGNIQLANTLVPKKLYDFTGYFGNNLPGIYSEWKEGNFRWDDVPYYWILRNTTQDPPNITAAPWRNDTASSNGTSLVFKHNSYQEHLDWLLSTPLKLPATTHPLLMTYDIAMLNINDTLFSGMADHHDFKVMIADECGALVKVSNSSQFLNYIPLEIYDTTTVNNKPLQLKLQNGFTDTLDLSPYAGENISLAFFSKQPHYFNVPLKRYDIFLDNIRFLIPEFDFAVTNVSASDTVCLNSEISLPVTFVNTGGVSGIPEGKIIYNGNQEISFTATQMLFPGDTLTEFMPPIVFYVPGWQEYTVILTHPYDTSAQNDTLKGTVYVQDASFYFQPASIVLDNNNLQNCLNINPDACDSVKWEVPPPLQIVSGGTGTDASVCFQVTGTWDTTVTVKATRYCKNCSDFKNIRVKIDVTINISELHQAGIKIRPNPVTDELRVEVPSRAEIALYSLQGRELYVGKCRKTSVIDMSDFSRGMYFLQVETSEGISRFKVIKE